MSDTDNFHRMVDEVADGETFTITRNGEPVAVITPVEDYDGLTETVAILSDDEAMRAIAEAEAELR